MTADQILANLDALDASAAKAIAANARTAAGAESIFVRDSTLLALLEIARRLKALEK